MPGCSLVRLPGRLRGAGAPYPLYAFDEAFAEAVARTAVAVPVAVVAVPGAGDGDNSNGDGNGGTGDGLGEGFIEGVQGVRSTRAPEAAG
ncbi:hypothetical protein EF908_07160 [Streptomyces sp. WAC04770]|nr:hypothetical protein [Streptomyces sp. WAC04770]RST24100.1 hypothetical protein EF908_07160 [Streptomyces sp. WAC04770]